MIGQCALCRTEDILLQDSHYMPKGVFRVVTRGHDPHDRAPVIIDVPGQSALRSNEQVRKNLLCAGCEGRFSKNGEDIVIPQCAQGEKQFGLLDAMKVGTPTDIQNGKVVYNGPSMPPGVDGSAYQYFAASIFWRGSVTRWPKSASTYFNSLGSRNEEFIRNYLLGKAEFPREMRIMVFVDYQDKTRGLAYFPTRRRAEMLGDRVWQHGFLIPGVRFILVVGRSLANFPDVGKTSLERIAMFEWHPTKTDFEQGLLEQLSVTRPKGSLAK